MANNEKVTEEKIPTETKKAANVKPHKCIITWNEDRVLRLFVARRNDVNVYITLFPGHNTVDYTDVLDIYKNNKTMFSQSTADGKFRLEFKGIEFQLGEDGEYTIKEGWTLAKTTANDFSKLVANMVNRDSLADLSNPDYVSIKYVDIADKRAKDLENFTGYTSEESEE